MKTLEQLLQLSKNPYYKFTPEEKRVLEDFFLNGSDVDSTKHQNNKSNKQSKKTRVIVRNVVKKADTYPPEAY